MSSKILLVSGGGGYILEKYNFKILHPDFDIIYIKNKKKNYLDISYEESDLENLFHKLNNKEYKEIVLISFGSHLGGSDPGLYFKSIINLENLLIKLSKINKPIYIYHSSSFSIYCPINNSSLFSFLIKDKTDIRGPYAFSKIQQNKVIRNFVRNNYLAKSVIVHIGHVYDKKNIEKQ